MHAWSGKIYIRLCSLSALNFSSEKRERVTKPQVRKSACKDGALKAGSSFLMQRGVQRVSELCLNKAHVKKAQKEMTLLCLGFHVHYEEIKANSRSLLWIDLWVRLSPEQRGESASAAKQEESN